MSRYTKTMREALQEVSSYDIPTTQDLELITEEIPAELPPGGPDVPRYKNVSNATVDKADKKANKEKKKVEKEVLDPKLDEENLDEFDLPPSTVSDKDLGDKINREHEKEKKRRAGIDAKKRGMTTIRKYRDRFKKESKDFEKIRKDQIEKEREALIKAVAKSPKQQALKKKQVKTPAHPDAALTKQRRGEEVEMDEKLFGQSGLLGYGPKGPSKAEKEKAQKKDKKDQDKAPVGKQHEELDEATFQVKTASHKRGKITVRNFNNLNDAQKHLAALKRKGLNGIISQSGTPVKEVAPPGWGHTKAEKEKTKPDKPKSKIGGSAHEFDKDLKSGKFKGLPGDKTMKDKKASMFKIMWSGYKKGDKTHYKPGEKGVKKNEEIIPEGSGWNSTFKTASQARPRMSFKEAEKFINELGFGGTEKKKALQAAKKWLK